MKENKLADLSMEFSVDIINLVKYFIINIITYKILPIFIFIGPKQLAYALALKLSL